MLDMTGSPRELTNNELYLLRVHEDEISAAESKQYWTLGKNLEAIRDRRLYRHAGSFEEYCVSRWGYRRQTVNRWIRAVEVARDMEACGVRAPLTEKQARPLWRLDSRERVAVARRVEEEGGWRRVAARRVGVIAEEVAPRPESAAVAERPTLVLVTRGGRVGPSRLAKDRMLRGLEAMATEADAIQALGSYAVEGAVQAMSAGESAAARAALLRCARLLARFDWAWAAAGQYEEADGQQALLTAA